MDFLGPNVFSRQMMMVCEGIMLRQASSDFRVVPMFLYQNPLDLVVLLLNNTIFAFFAKFQNLGFFIGGKITKRSNMPTLGGSGPNWVVGSIFMAGLGLGRVNQEGLTRNWADIA